MTNYETLNELTDWDRYVVWCERNGVNPNMDYFEEWLNEN